jgi:hypothetical protein
VRNRRRHMYGLPLPCADFLARRMSRCDLRLSDPASQIVTMVYSDAYSAAVRREPGTRSVRPAACVSS